MEILSDTSLGASITGSLHSDTIISREQISKGLGVIIQNLEQDEQRFQKAQQQRYLNICKELCDRFCQYIDSHDNDFRKLDTVQESSYDADDIYIAYLVYHALPSLGYEVEKYQKQTNYISESGYRELEDMLSEVDKKVENKIISLGCDRKDIRTLKHQIKVIMQIAQLLPSQTRCYFK